MLSLSLSVRRLLRLLLTLLQLLEEHSHSSVSTHEDRIKLTAKKHTFFSAPIDTSSMEYHLQNSQAEAQADDLNLLMRRAGGKRANNKITYEEFKKRATRASVKEVQISLFSAHTHCQLTFD